MKRNKVDYIFAGYSDSDGLRGGQWMRDTWGVVRWVQTHEVDQEQDDFDAPVTPAIGCPVCKAKVNETCKTRNGYPRDNHAKRYAERTCPCGEPPRRGGSYCMACSDASKRRAWRKAKRRARAQEREDVA